MAIQKPKFALNFVNGARLDPRISCTRSTEASYFGRDGVMRWAAVNEPRLDFDPITLACLGLLSEEARTNLFTYSDQFNNAAWPKTQMLAFGSGSVADAIAAPDGSMTADYLQENTVAGNHAVSFQSQSLTAGTAYTYSIHVKAAGRDHLRMQINGASWTDAIAKYAHFNIATGTVVATNGTQIIGRIKALPNGWFRCSITFTPEITIAATGTMMMGYTSGGLYYYSYTGDGTSGMYFWGAQGEQGAWSSTYIRTTTAAVARSHDLPLIDTNAFGTGWFNPNAGTIFEEFSSSAVAGGVSRYPYSMDAGISSTRFSQPTTVSATFQPQIVVSGSDGLTGGAFAVVDGINKGVIAYSTATSRSAANGEVSVETASVPLPGTLSRLYLGTFSTSVTSLNGHLRRFAYWDFKISDGNTDLAHLQKLTAL